MVGIDDKKFTAHSLRHTCATLALKNGATIQEVQMLLRHKSLNTTTIYAHNLDRISSDTEYIVDEVISKKR
jgi:site-specific recombinase XerD